MSDGGLEALSCLALASCDPLTALRPGPGRHVQGKGKQRGVYDRKRGRVDILGLGVLRG